MSPIENLTISLPGGMLPHWRQDPEALRAAVGYQKQPPGRSLERRPQQLNRSRAVGQPLQSAQGRISRPHAAAARIAGLFSARLGLPPVRHDLALRVSLDRMAASRAGVRFAQDAASVRRRNGAKRRACLLSGGGRLSPVDASGGRVPLPLQRSYGLLLFDSATARPPPPPFLLSNVSQ